MRCWASMIAAGALADGGELESLREALRCVALRRVVGGDVTACGVALNHCSSS